MTTVTNAKLQQWIDKLDDAVPDGDGKNYRAVCPGHGGHALLFFYDQRRDRVVWTCKAGCDAKDLAPQLRALGITLYGDQLQFTYTHADGSAAFIKVKWYKNGEKKQPFYRCFSKHGVPVNHRSLKLKMRNTDGTCKNCGLSDLPTILYRLDKLQHADHVWLCEGEKDADAVAEQGVIATSTKNGSDDWNATYRDQLSHVQRVTIWAHDDPGGYKGAWKRYTSLSEFDIAIKIVKAKRGNDAFDHFVNGFELADVVEISPEDLAQLANPGTPTTSLGEGEKQFEYTQSEYADRFVSYYSDRFRYIPEEDRWLYYSDGRWREDQYDAAFHFGEQVALQILNETPEKNGDKPNPWRSRARTCCGSGQIRDVIRIARTRRPIVTRRGKFDTDPDLVNFPNGTYHLREDKLRPHNPDDMITKMCEFDFNPQATGPIFDEYFAAVQPDEHWREQILRSLGYAIHGRYGEFAFIHTGSGGNGKSTMLSIASKCFGDYAVSASWKVLSAKSETEHESLLASLEGHRYAVVQMGGHSVSSEQLRTLVAEPEFTARKMRQDERAITATHTFHIAQNDPPPMRQLDPSTRRRIIVIPWEITVENPDDTLRDRILASEGSYVVTQLTLAQARFVRTEIDRNATEEYFERNRSYAFIVRNTEREANSFVSTGELYGAYEKWCRDAGEKPETETRFGIVLTALGFEKGRTTVDGKLATVRYGLRLNDTE